MPEIIIKWKPKHGKSRSEIETNLIKEGWGSSITPEEIDKCRFLERKIKDKHGADHSHIRTTAINRVR
jgi:hypothetical protein